jgi:hypothetical protein
MHWRKLMIAVIFLCLGAYLPGVQPVRFVPNGSFSKRTGVQSKYWESGFSMGLNAYLPLSSRLLFGLRAGYTRWSPDGYQMMALAPNIRMKAQYTNRIDTVNSPVDWPDYAGKDSLDYENLYLYKSKSGSTTIIEVIPSIRWVALGDLAGEMSLSLQFGAGLYMLNSKATAVGQYGPQFTKVSLDEVSGAKLGFQISLPLSMKNRLELHPVWNFLMTGDDPIQYFSLSLGLIF